MSSSNHHPQYLLHHNNGGVTAPSSYPYAQRSTEPETAAAPLEDCRDYLRTGRCKYGASCKYNHPSNVQSGGGMKTPIDPSEPLYPIRPNEPVCQYFLKHGTCKFGQACKFHHPPQMAGTASMMNNNAVLVSLPTGRKPDGMQGIWTTSVGANDSGVQILPQRPDEPNCIYFLKNGRCKYGATCRYHHPLNFHDRSNGRTVYEENGRSRHTLMQQDHRAGGTKVHYVTTLPPGSVQQGHFVVSDGTVTFLSLDGATPAHVVSVPQPAGNVKDGQLLYTTTPGTVTSSSSSTSIASSYETAISNLDGQDSSSSVWNRKPVPSNGHNGYNLSNDHGRNHIQGNRTLIIQNVGDGGVLGLPRVVSTGSTSDGSTIFFDANGHPQPTAWRSSRSSSFDQTRSRGASFHSQGDEIQRSMSVHSALDEAGRPRPSASHSPMMHSRSRHGSRNQRQPGEVDEGLSQMTSALLTMLDTPEEAASHQAPYDFHEDDEQQALTPRMGTRYSSRPGNDRNGHLLQTNNGYTSHQQAVHHSQQPKTFLESPDYQINEDRIAEHPTSWLPSWQDSIAEGDGSENSQSLKASQSSSSPHHNSSHVGLYLP
ncbi:zinc finger domain containing protein [Nitzschia inconspicua]|uniref:Zinc finger domain containing protein n=1 Tax=Nitzschia inconspicua TaxID=303405 RepID=A0A9K3PYI3_9STRA|nr:zinc finger domain containing protein [Nitzschia inconspicua]